MRGIAALAVMGFHFNIFFLPQARLPFLGRAYLAVDLFFLISGFVMAHTYGQELASNWRLNWRKFAIARFARIYPLFALTLLAMIAIVSLSHAQLQLVSFSDRALALQPFLLQQWSGLSWNYPSWSISTEAEAYLFFVFSAGLLVKGKYPCLMAAWCVAILAALCIHRGGSLNLYSGISVLVRTLSEFSLGTLLYRASSCQVGLSCAWALFLAILFVGLATITNLDFLIIGAFAGLIYYCVNATDAFGKLLNSRPSVTLGNWSYSIYLWQAPIHYAVMVTFAARGCPVSDLDLWSARLLLLATTLAVVAISAVTYQNFETRARRSLVYATAITA